MSETKFPAATPRHQLGKLEQVRQSAGKAGQIGWADGFDAVRVTGKEARALRALAKSVKHPVRRAKLVPDRG
jgi:hypothetical protein